MKKVILEKLPLLSMIVPDEFQTGNCRNCPIKDYCEYLWWECPLEIECELEEEIMRVGDE